ncbi:MAG: radical SAM protein [Lachnospiraceae bacterium]|nr:radical SAM protein [Lachnospiraceae bacterium]
MIKKIAIWGTGKSALKVFDFIKNYSSLYKVVAFIENNVCAQGEKLFGLPVDSYEKIHDKVDYDVILIASVFYEEISKQIEATFNDSYVKRCEDLEGVGYREAIIEVSGICNAKCAWCITGKDNRAGVQLPNIKYLNLEQFKKIYNKLIELGAINKNTTLSLYNWGEPLLNPNFEEIVLFLNSKEQKFAISTNASVYKKLNDSQILQHLEKIYISMPGFSQDSYDKIHGFNFEQIKRNIVNIVKNYRNCGFSGKVYISYHIYQFSMEEYLEAKKFAESNDIELNPYFAYFNGISMAIDYMENKMEYEILKQAGKQLILSYVDDYLKKRPSKYICPQLYQIVIDTEGNLNLCCAADKYSSEYIIGKIESIQELSELKMMKEKSMNCLTCKKCQEYAIDFWANNPKTYVN